MTYPFRISSDYGPRPIGDGFHDGIDFDTPDIGALLGTPVNGLYVYDYDANAYGRMGWVIGDDRNWYLLAHLSEHVVRDNTRVIKGQTIARSGGRKGQNGAGNSTGSHLHFEVRLGGKKGKSTNPDPKYIGGLWYPVEGKEPDMPLNDTDKKWIKDTVKNEVQNSLRGSLYLIFTGHEVESLPVGPDFDWRKGLDLEALHAKLNRIIAKTEA